MGYKVCSKKFYPQWGLDVSAYATDYVRSPLTGGALRQDSGMTESRSVKRSLHVDSRKLTKRPIRMQSQ